MDIRKHYPAIAEYVVKRHRRTVAYKNSIFNKTIAYPILIDETYLTIILKPNTKYDNVKNLCENIMNTFDLFDRWVYTNGTNKVRLYMKG